MERGSGADNADMAEPDDAALPDAPDAPDDGPAQIAGSEAEYTLEYACLCPYCEQSVQSVRVVRALRTRVNFTSTLPRRGRIIICPKCRKILTAELTSLT